MSKTPSVFLCESCGAKTSSPCRLPRGRHVWCVCDRCAEALDGSYPQAPVFGAPLRDLPQPAGGYAGWWSYRIACEELGYTLYHADTRQERDALHRRWNQWLGGLLLLADTRDILMYRNALEGADFVNAWDRTHRAVRIPDALAEWLLPRIVHESKKDVLTRAPSRATLEAAAGVPKRGALAKQTA